MHVDLLHLRVLDHGVVIAVHVGADFVEAVQLVEDVEPG